MTKPTVHIIGSGISGLRCAENLLQCGIEVKIVERSDSIGGRMRTTEKNGFLLDHGFHVMQTGYPHSRAEIDFKELGARRFSPGAKIVKSSAGKAKQYVLSDPFRSPISSISALFTQKWSDLYNIAKLTLSLGFESPDRIFEGSDGTTESYLRKSGFSEPFISEFLRPLFSGIFLESKLETSERMFKFVFASMARGDMVLPKGGIQAYPNLIADRIGRERIELSTLATPVDTTTLVLGGREVKTDQVVVAHPQRETADCMNSVWTVYFSAPDNSIKGNYILLNGNYEVGKNAIAHIAVPSNIQPTYSPSGKSLVAVTIVGDAAKALDLDSDESIENQARLELRDLFEKSDTWETIEVFHTKNGLPPSESQSNASSTVNFNQDEIICCGDHTTHGSMEGAIKSADHAAREVVRRLGISA